MAMAGRVAIHANNERIAKRKPKSISIQLYAEFISRYDVHLSCDICLHIHRNGTASIGDSEHPCFKTHLVLFTKTKSQTGIQIRVRPSRYSWRNSVNLCEHVLNEEECPEKQRCPCPHSELEAALWKRDENREIDIASFISDLAESCLKSKHFVEYLCNKYKGQFKLICRRCFLEDGAHVTAKKTHKPQCTNDHQWSRNKYIVFNCENGKTIQVEKSRRDEPSADEKELVECIESLLEYDGISRDELEDMATRYRQRKHSKSSTTIEDRSIDLSIAANDTDDDEYISNDRHIPYMQYDDDIYDSDCDHLQDDTVDDPDVGDRYGEKVSGYDTRASFEKYYTMISKEEAVKLVAEDSKYHRGIIELKGSFDAVCHITEGEMKGLDIDITGRRNLDQRSVVTK